MQPSPNAVKGVFTKTNQENNADGKPNTINIRPSAEYRSKDLSSGFNVTPPIIALPLQYDSEA
jgi:hypothetical protein